MLIETKIEGTTVFIETDEVYGFEHTSSDVLDRSVAKIDHAFENAKESITGIAKSLSQSIQSLSSQAKPKKFELEFSIKFGAEGQIIVAKASGEATLKVTMTYE